MRRDKYKKFYLVVQMNSKLQVNYSIDKLILVYSVPNCFMSLINNDDSLTDSYFGRTNVFIFTRKYCKRKYVVPRYVVEYRVSENETIKIGEFKPDIEQSITFEVDNALFYLGRLYLLYELEESFNLKFESILQFDVACDSNHNLPRKLNNMMHRSDCTVSRRGTKLPVTENGNQVIGTKVLKNIKVLTKREKNVPSYYFQIKYSGSRRPIIYRGYNKSKEISEKSHKNYIIESCCISGTIYRFEVAINGYDIKRQSKRKNGYSIEYIYRHLEDKMFLKDIFVQYINRIATLNINGRSYRISEILRLE